MLQMIETVRALLAFPKGLLPSKALANAKPRDRRLHNAEDASSRTTGSDYTHRASDGGVAAATPR